MCDNCPGDIIIDNVNYSTNILSKMYRDIPDNDDLLFMYNGIKCIITKHNVMHIANLTTYKLSVRLLNHNNDVVHINKTIGNEVVLEPLASVNFGIPGIYNAVRTRQRKLVSAIYKEPVNPSIFETVEEITDQIIDGLTNSKIEAAKLISTSNELKNDLRSIVFKSLFIHRK